MYSFIQIFLPCYVVETKPTVWINDDQMRCDQEIKLHMLPSDNIAVTLAQKAT